MPKKMKAKDLAKIRGMLVHFKGTEVKVEHVKGGKTRLLSGIMPDINSKGRFTTRIIRVEEDGRRKNYDGNYEFEVTAILVGGERFPLE